ncbi:MAG: polysaccharide biosynthesis tyrosine autokinase [Actinobacteria bacterium]|nr:polysaccharide biosynthesis tyrosine autokinase [Actinomycetota bacterium]
MSQFESQTQTESFDLREYLNVLKVRKWLILGIAALVLAAALIFSFTRTPAYESEAQVLLRPIALLTTEANLEEVLNVKTETLIATSPEVAQLAAESLGEEDALALLKGLEVTDEADTEVLSFTYSNTNRKQAQERAQAFADGYIEYRRTTAQERVDSYASAIQEKISALQAQLDEIEQRIAGGEELQNQADTLNAQIGFEQTKLFDLASNSSLDVGTVLYDAYYPGAPTSPNHSRTGAIALIVGLGFGLGAAFVRERFDDRLAGRADLETHVGAAVLAVVPKTAAWRKAGETYLVTEADPHSVTSEAYRTLRTGLLFAASQREIKTVMVTSAHAAEGKTATAANLGVVLAQAGKRVILVSADLRKPRLNNFFGLRSRKGLTNVLAGEAKAIEALVPVGVAASNLRLLPSGPIPGNPAELLGSDAMGRLMADLRAAADFVLIDVAPVLAVADAMTLAPMADATLFIADASQATGTAIEQARQQLDQVNARLIGAVLNNYDASKSATYSSQPYAHYRHTEDEPVVKRTFKRRPKASRNA